MLPKLRITGIENIFQHLLQSYDIASKYKPVFYVDNSVYDDRLDVKITCMKRVIFCLYRNILSVHLIVVLQTKL